MGEIREHKGKCSSIVIHNALLDQAKTMIRNSIALRTLAILFAQLVEKQMIWKEFKPSVLPLLTYSNYFNH